MIIVISIGFKATKWSPLVSFNVELKGTRDDHVANRFLIGQQCQHKETFMFINNQSGSHH